MEAIENEIFLNKDCGLRLQKKMDGEIHLTSGYSSDISINTDHDVESVCAKKERSRRLDHCDSLTTLYLTSIPLSPEDIHKYAWEPTCKPDSTILNHKDVCNYKRFASCPSPAPLAGTSTFTVGMGYTDKIPQCVMCGRSDVNIPSQNKNICKNCDSLFWLHSYHSAGSAENVVFKFCKGCKIFYFLCEFSEKPDGTKCCKCRQRGRELYLAKKSVPSTLSSVIFSPETEIEESVSHGSSPSVSATVNEISPTSENASLVSQKRPLALEDEELNYCRYNDARPPKISRRISFSPAIRAIPTAPTSQEAGSSAIPVTKRGIAMIPTPRSSSRKAPLPNIVTPSSGSWYCASPQSEPASRGENTITPDNRENFENSFSKLSEESSAHPSISLSSSDTSWGKWSKTKRHANSKSEDWQWDPQLNPLMQLALASSAKLH